jgi:hypothetical protein
MGERTRTPEYGRVNRWHLEEVDLRLDAVRQLAGSIAAGDVDALAGSLAILDHLDNAQRHLRGAVL